MKTYRASITTMLFCVAAFFLLTLILTLSGITAVSIETRSSQREVNAYGVLSTQDPAEIERVKDEIKTRLKNSRLKIINTSENENNIIVVTFSHLNGVKKLKTYLNTIENVDKWIFDTDLKAVAYNADQFILHAALAVFLLSLLAMLITLFLFLKSNIALYRQEMTTWEGLGATKSQIRNRFVFPLFLPPISGIFFSLVFSSFIINAKFEPRIETPDLGPILLSMSQTPSIVSEIVFPSSEPSSLEPPMKAKKRDWSAPVNDFWSRKRIRNIESARQGVLMEANAGEAVLAASEGVVVYDGQMRGLGKLVIVDHGKGLHSVYAHLGEIKTRIDERLQKGQTLGYIGDNVFYFELRQNGKPKAVDSFIRKP